MIIESLTRIIYDFDGDAHLNPLESSAMADEDEFFPSSPRVVYTTSPLNEVICQVRFPTVLKIDQGPPADFQELIRSKFPYYEMQSTPMNGPPVPPEVISMLGLPVQQQHMFRSENGKRYINLMNNAIAIVSSEYTRWEGFVAEVELGLAALAKIYRPNFYQRIGLRYQNLVNPEKLGFGARNWAAMLNNEIATELRHENFGAGQVVEAHRMIRVTGINAEGVLLQHGIGALQDVPADSYIIDIDCYTDARTEEANAIEVLQRFNVRARRAFRWCISDELHEALGPNDVEHALIQ